MTAAAVANTDQATGRGIFLAGKWVNTGATATIRSPYDGHEVADVQQADESHFREAIDAAVDGAAAVAALPAYSIAAALERMKAYLGERAEEVARILAEEAGKPLKLGRYEVARALHIIEDGVEESKRQGGEIIPLDRRPWGAGRIGRLQRFPLGVIGAITPFNFPFHLVAHKIVPALASRNAIILKPAPQTPLSALFWAAAFETTDLPREALSILPASPEAARPLLEDDRVRGLSFTGSAAAGWQIKAQAARKKVALELGGNAGAIVHRDAGIEQAAEALAAGGFAFAGQSCISVQRIFVHASVYDALAEALVAAAESLSVGDPHDEQTDVGPLISAAAVDRVAAWIDEAVAQGAKVLTGGRREGSLIWPTVLAGTTPQMKVNCAEVFGPVVTLTPYDDFAAALAQVNDSPFGLQAGVFTQDARLIEEAYRTLQVGGVMVNAAPTWRIDHMPYGGIKASGEGREGVRYAMEFMTEPKLLVTGG